MKKVVFEFEIDDLHPENAIKASDVFWLVSQRFPMSLVSVKAVEHSVQLTAESDARWEKMFKEIKELQVEVLEKLGGN